MKELCAPRSRRCSPLPCLAWPAPAPAQDYPNRPVRIIVGFPPGTSRRHYRPRARRRMGQILGQQFVVENKPGAGSNLAAEFVARAPKDGYTLLMATSANTINAGDAAPTSVRLPEGLRADRAAHHRAATCWWCIPRSASRPCRN